MSFCSQCGNKQSEEAKFCFSCGAPRASTKPEEAASISSSLDDLASEIIETYLGVSSNDNFDPESVTEETFLAVTYAELARQEAAVPNAAGIEMMKQAMISLTELSESLDEED